MTERTASGIVFVAGDLRDAAFRSACLSAVERKTASGFRLAARRRTWLAGRVAAHLAVTALMPELGKASRERRLSVHAAEDGAPEVWLDGTRVDCSVSIAHRGSRVVAAAVNLPRSVGCDVELIEPRSAAFVRDFFTDEETAFVGTAPDPALAANLVWCAKEAVLKIRRTGLRRDTRSVVVRAPNWPTGSPDAVPDTDWADLEVVDLIVRSPVHACWRKRSGYVYVVAVDSD